MQRLPPLTGHNVGRKGVTHMRRTINTETEQRGYIWRCQTNADKRRFIAKSDEKMKPCFKWNPYFGRKWAATKRDARWQGICICKRKRQLNLGVVLPEPPNYYATRQETRDAADEENQQEEMKQAKRNADDSDSRRFL